MGGIQLLNHFSPAVAVQILDVLRPAAAQEAGWLGLAEGAGVPAAEALAPGQTGRSEADDLSDITSSTHVHLGAWLSPGQARQAGVADPRRLAAVLSLAPDHTPGQLCIKLLVVAPWAQRRGLARALVQAALQRGRGWGFSVTAACANVAALALYRGLGFVPGRQGLMGVAQVPVVQLLRAAEPPLEGQPTATHRSAFAVQPSPSPAMNQPLSTEAPHPEHQALDGYDTATLVDTFAAEQASAVAAVRAAGPALARAVDQALPRLQAGGRLLYAGAGTSGRLGVLDSVELHPTFSWPRERARALLAGGEGAMFVAVEGAEDSTEQGAADLAALVPTPQDVVLCIAASGTTPYALGVAAAARAVGALVVGLANNPGTPLLAAADIAVLLDTGPELISGSTRLKAGTAQKIALNTFSSSLMVRLHKTYGHLMVDLRATNAKLLRRALALTVRASGASEADAQAALQASGQQVKLAVVMLKAGLDVAQAQARLDAAEGSVRAALGEG